MNEFEAYLSDGIGEYWIPADHPKLSPADTRWMFNGVPLPASFEVSRYNGNSVVVHPSCGADAGLEMA